MSNFYRFGLVLIIVFANSLAFEEEFIPSLCRTELNLLDDSTNAYAWGQYGLSLLFLGSNCSGRALQTCALLGNSQEGIRGNASLAIQDGEIDTALEMLSLDSSDVFVKIMQCAILQKTGKTEESDSLLSLIAAASPPAGTEELLLIRQARLIGQDQFADSIAYSAGSMHGMFADIIALDYYVSSQPAVPEKPDQIIAGIRADAILTGSVYLDQVISLVSRDSVIQANPFFAARIHYLAGDRRESSLIMDSVPFDRKTHEELVFQADLLLQLDHLNKAESVVTQALSKYPESSELLGILGFILLKGGKYQELYYRMDDAVCLTGSPECMALMGLSAEMAGEFVQAVSGYAPLLDMSADSVVLINRTRNRLRSDLLHLPYNSSSSGTPWQNPGAGLRMNFSLGYFKSTGTYPQESISLTSKLTYRYGLYRSNLSLSARYSENTWPGAENKLRRLKTSASLTNFTSRNFFQSLEFNREESRSETRRWKFETIVGCGFSKNIGPSLMITPSVGVGRIINQWDDEMYQQDAYVYTPGMLVVFSNFLSTTFNPSISVKLNSSCEFADSDQYGIDLSFTLAGAINRLLSLSYSYNINYQSIVPPENDSETNTNSNAFLNFHF